MTSLTSTSAYSSLGAAQDGIQRGLSKAAHAAQAIANGESDPQHIIDLIQGQRAVGVNTQVLRAADEVIGTMLDRKV